MKWITWTAALVLVLATPARGAEDGNAGFDRITDHYEKIRVTLLHDSVEGVAAEADAIAGLVTKLQGGFEPAEAGIVAGKSGEFEHLLPSLGQSAAALAGATDIKQIREHFAELSKGMVAYRQMTEDPDPVVVFCPMAQKVWLQPSGEIGNPYHGQSMPRCGEVVSE